MASSEGKLHLYVFLSIFVIFLNLSAVVVSAYETDKLSYDPNELIVAPDGYYNMTEVQRDDWLIMRHGGKYILDIEKTGTLLYPDGYRISGQDYIFFCKGIYYENLKKDFDYSQSGDTSFVSKVVGSVGGAFLPFSTFIINAKFFKECYPLNIIVGVLVMMLSIIQIYLLTAMILNFLPWFHT